MYRTVVPSDPWSTGAPRPGQSWDPCGLPGVGRVCSDFRSSSLGRVLRLRVGIPLRPRDFAGAVLFRILVGWPFHLHTAVPLGNLPPPFLLLLSPLAHRPLSSLARIPAGFGTHIQSANPTPGPTHVKREVGGPAPGTRSRHPMGPLARNPATTHAVGTMTGFPPLGPIQAQNLHGDSHAPIRGRLHIVGGTQLHHASTLQKINILNKYYIFLTNHLYF